MRFAAFCLAMISFAAPASADSLGLQVDNLLASQSLGLFGINAPLSASAPASALTGYRKKTDAASDTVALAPGLTAEFVTRKAANVLDQLLLYPPASPRFIIACIETGRQVIGALGNGDPKYNPSIQRINLKTGAVTTILRGMDRCDGVRATAWNTVIVNEETTGGHVYELLKPLSTSEATVTDWAASTITTPDIQVQSVLPRMAWEGFGITRDGVLYGGDELRPGSTSADADGGALYKFIPSTLWDGNPITSLNQSPLHAGNSFALRISCVPEISQYGQGCQDGNGSWISVDPLIARADAAAKGATGYYRPEDMHIDPSSRTGQARVCVTITEDAAAKQYGKVLCFLDSAPTQAPQPGGGGAITPTVDLRVFISGDPTFNQPDNIEFQPKSRNLHVVEDNPNGDIFACLQDGRDHDIQSDGCVRWLSAKDSSAEPSGLIFDPTGTVAYVSISHSDDTAMPSVDGFGTDDLIKITGFKN